MREVKFRAWLTLSGEDDDGNDKDYYAMTSNISVHHTGDIGFSVDEGKNIFKEDIFEKALDSETVSEYEEWCLWEGPFELMQYTGLKDKNGVEIYEGDIVTIEHPFRDRKWTGRIEFDRYKFTGRRFYFSHYDVPNDLFSEGTEYIKVIGNIYENTELLEN